MFEKIVDVVKETGGLGKFSEGKDFANAFKDDGGFGKDFADAFKKDAGLTDFANSFCRSETPPLADKKKEKIKNETDWDLKIIDSISSMDEYEIYKNAGLEETEINGKPCLVRDDIDWNQKDEWGRTNKERAEQGLAPIDKNGKSIELHYIGQKSDSPLAELTQEEHRGKGNDSVLHDKNKESEIDRREFQKEKEEYWGARAREAQ